MLLRIADIPVEAFTAPAHAAVFDGIRTIAVFLVALFHVSVPGFDAGFIGVDMFFVLSGYLVTQVLTRDLDRTGSIRFRRFYARRARRLPLRRLTRRFRFSWPP